MKKYVARGLGCAGGILLSVSGAPALAEEAAPAPGIPVVTKEQAKAPFGGPMATGGGWTLDPILDARLRYEAVDQDDIGLDADAVTLRVRAGIDVKSPGGFSMLAEMEGTGALGNDFNAFPFAIVDQQRRLDHSVVADPENVELNRLQIGFENDDIGVTLGRQRINLGDQRWVGSVGWRQNEQTFDAVRVRSSALGPVTLDVIYSNSQRTIFGTEAKERSAFDGDYYFGNAGLKLGPVDVTAFSYLIDYDDDEPVAPPVYFDTQTYGLVASGSIPLGEGFALSLKGSYAVQKDYAENPFDYSVDYIAAEAGASYAGFGLTGGYEELGADDSGNRVQTPFATMHKFNGWADVFLATPVLGLKDYYVTLGKKLPGVRLLPGLNAAVTYHKFESEELDIDYGEEWNALIGFKLLGLGATIKYADFDADDGGPYTDVEKLWLQIEYAF